MDTELQMNIMQIQLKLSMDILRLKNCKSKENKLKVFDDIESSILEQKNNMSEENFLKIQEILEELRETYVTN